MPCSQPESVPAMRSSPGPFTFVATVVAIFYTSATPVFVGVDPCYLTMDADSSEFARRAGSDIW